MRAQVYPSHQPNFGPTPGNPGSYAQWGHAPYPPYPQGSQGTPWYGPPQAPNHPFPSGMAYYPTEPQILYPSYGSGHHSAPQWHPNPEPRHSRPSPPHPTSYDHRVHTSHARRGPAELSPQQHFYLQNAPSSTSGPIRRRPSEPAEDTHTAPNFRVDHGAYTPHSGRPADLPHFPPFPPQEAFSWNSTPQWPPNPEPQNHGHPSSRHSSRPSSRPSYSHPTYDQGAHILHSRRGADLPQQNPHPQNAPSSASGPVRRRPSEPSEDANTASAPNTPHSRRGADLPQQNLYPQSASNNTSGPVHRRPSEPLEDANTASAPNTPHTRRGADLPQQHFHPQNASSSASGPVRRRPSEPTEDTRSHPNTPHPSRPATLPQNSLPPQEPSSWMPQTSGPVRRYPSEPAEGREYFSNPTVGPTAPYQPAPTPTAPYHLVTTLVPNVSRYPSIDWNITLPIGSARLWMSPKHKTMIDFSQFAIVPPVRTVTIVARKAASPLGLALKIWGPIQIKAEEQLTIGSILKEIKKFFDTPIQESDRKLMDRYLLQSIPASNSKRWKTQEDDRAVWGKSVQIEVCRADTLFENFQYGGLKLDKDFRSNRKIELTLENARARYLN